MVKAELKRKSPESLPNINLQKRPAGAAVILAFAAVYLIWGSTYLAIRFAIETLPPFLMSGTRFLIAGTILFIWSSFRGKDHSAGHSLAQWRRAFIVGGLLLLCGNGGVVWSEKYLPSGLTALLVATEPLWVVALNWGLSRKRPNAKVLLGVLIGLAGVALLVSGGLKKGAVGSPMSPVATGIPEFVAAGVVIASALAWAAGSVYSNRRPIKAPTLMAAGMQMLAGGSLLVLMALITGDFQRLNFNRVSWLSIGAVFYLLVFGSIVGFTAYSWLMRNVAPARAATYAYVNPMVAVFLGWLLASEPFTPKVLIAGAVIVSSVVLITTYGADESQQPAQPDTREKAFDSEEIAADLLCPNPPCA